MTPSPEPPPSPSPSPSSKPEIVLTNYKVLALNGTGGKGVAAAVKNILEAQGFENIKADNADSFNFAATEVQLKKDIPNEIWKAIEKALSSNADTVLSVCEMQHYYLSGLIENDKYNPEYKI